jgi:hypothetical protein
VDSEHVKILIFHVRSCYIYKIYNKFAFSVVLYKRVGAICYEPNDTRNTWMLGN